MFGFGKLKVGEYVFSVRKEGKYNKLVIGRIQNINKTSIKVIGSLIRPIGLIERLESGKIGPRSAEVLDDPTPNNCIFILIDRIEYENTIEEIKSDVEKIEWINEKRYLVLDGWLKENLSELFADVFRAKSLEERDVAKNILLEKMHSLSDRDLKDHVYSVVRSTKII